MQILKPLLAVLAALFSQVAFAGSAKLFIHPTLIELDDRQRSAALSVVNRGDAVGTFAIDWIDYAMTEEGGLTVAADDAEWSLQPHIRHSPRRVTLRPGETQTVKLALRRRGVAKGEYYSHLKVLMLNDDVAAPGTADDAAAGESLTIDARSAIAVPVVWRNTNAEPRAVIDSVVIDREQQALEVEITRIGDLSTRGFLHVLRVTGDGTRTPLTQPLPLVIYPSVERRTATVPLDAGAYVVDAQGPVEVVYSSSAETNDAATEFASYLLTP